MSDDRVATVPPPNRVLAGPPPRRRWLRWAVPIAAGTVALATVAVVGLLARRDDAPADFTRGPALDAARVVAELEAAAAKTRVPSLPERGYLYQRRDTRDGAGRQVTEHWAELNGLITVKMRVDGKDADSRPSVAELADAARDRLAREGPDLEHPTPAWLAAQPADPDRLVPLLRAGLPESEPTAGPCVALFLHADPLLPGPLRLALLKVLAATPGLSASEVRIGGKRHYALRYRGRVDGPTELFFDPATAHAVGGAVLLSQADPGPSAGPQADSLQLWTFKVLSKLPS